MCCIIDADEANRIFHYPMPPKTQAAGAFIRWLKYGRGKLVLGGKLRKELNITLAKDWLAEASRSGRIIQINDRQVQEATDALIEAGGYKSTDPHVIALAQVSGARLLYSNDGRLHQDFTNPDLVNNPPGKVYSTRESTRMTRRKRLLLDDRNLCIA